MSYQQLQTQLSPNNSTANPHCEWKVFSHLQFPHHRESPAACCCCYLSRIILSKITEANDFECLFFVFSANSVCKTRNHNEFICGSTSYSLQFTFIRNKICTDEWEKFWGGPPQRWNEVKWRERRMDSCFYMCKNGDRSWEMINIIVVLGWGEMN